MPKVRARRGGRPRDPNAKWRETTREGQGRIRDPLERCGCCGLPTSLTVRKRLEAVGADFVGLDFPLDALYSPLRLITQDERDEGLRFTLLCWWRYPMPHASCQALYDRMVAGVLGDDFAPRPEGEADDAEENERRLARVAAAKRRHDAMIQALTKAAPRELVLKAVKAATQLCEMPAFARLIGTTECTQAHWYEFARLKKGLEILVALRDAEDRHWRRRRGKADATEISR